MATSRWKSAPGITLVELLVVLGMISILAALAVPGMARIGVFSRNELQRSSRELYAFLRAARIYASTFNVNTAVAYSFDNYTSPSLDANNDGYLDGAGDTLMVEPMTDSVTGNIIRIIRSAAMLYELPSTSGAFAGKYVPVKGEQGDFRTLTGRTCILLNNPVEPGFPDLIQPLLTPRLPADYPKESDAGSGVRGLSELGMTKIEAYLEDSGPLAPPGDPARDNPVTAFFPAHVFRSSGRLITAGAKERYTIYVAPGPEEDPSERLVDIENPNGEFVHTPIQLFKSTGRVKIAS